MAEPFTGEIRLFSFAFAPEGWALCNGQSIEINQNQPLFALLGTTFGGDGRTTFALPNMQGRIPIHAGAGYTLGEFGGEAGHTLRISELPAHTHRAMAALQTPFTSGIVGMLPARAQIWSTAASLTQLSVTGLTNTGGSQSHENRQPFLTISFCIALKGVFPSRN